MELFEKLNEVFRKVFNDDEINVTRETTANDIDNWDSMSHINLVLAVERTFGIKFKQSEIYWANVGGMYDSIKEKLGIKE